MAAKVLNQNIRSVKNEVNLTFHKLNSENSSENNENSNNSEVDIVVTSSFSKEGADSMWKLLQKCIF